MTVTFSEYPIEKVIEGMLRQLCVILQGRRHIIIKPGAVPYHLEMEEINMDKGKCRKAYQEVISMEEYLKTTEDQRVREEGKEAGVHEKSPAWYAGRALRLS